MTVNNLIETHCHIIPNIDDGAKDSETAIAMINKLQAQGAKAIILTPHFYTDAISLDDFVTKRDLAFNKLKADLGDNAPLLIPAAEVYITKYLFNYESLDSITIGNSRYALIEHSFSCDFQQDTYDRLLNLYYDYKIKPILVHVERYPALMENPELLDDYIDMGCLVQANINSFAEAHRGVRKKLFKYLESGRIHLIGSDCHNLSSRPPEYEKGVKEIIKKCGQEAIDTLEKNARLLLS